MFAIHSFALSCDKKIEKTFKIHRRPPLENIPNVYSHRGNQDRLSPGEKVNTHSCFLFKLVIFFIRTLHSQINRKPTVGGFVYLLFAPA